MRALYAVCAVWCAVTAAPAPPPLCAPLEDAPAARCLMHAATWGVIASLSTRPEISGYPFASVKSVAAGETGVPYLYLTPLDIAVHDLVVSAGATSAPAPRLYHVCVHVCTSDNRTTLVVSEAAEGRCARRGLDPMNPLCARLMMSGVMRAVPAGDAEHAPAWSALLHKHPEFQHYPPDHGFFIAKIDPTNIFLLNAHGPVKRVPVAEYLGAPHPPAHPSTHPPSPPSTHLADATPTSTIRYTAA